MIIALIIVALVLCAGWLIVKSQYLYDDSQDETPEKDEHEDHLGIG